VSLSRAFTQGSNDAAEVRGSFQETALRKTTENTVKHRDGGVGSVAANHRGGGESSVVVTTPVSRPIQHKIGQFGDAFPSQSFGIVLENKNRHNKSKHASITKYTTT